MVRLIAEMQKGRGDVGKNMRRESRNNLWLIRREIGTDTEEERDCDVAF